MLPHNTLHAAGKHRAHAAVRPWTSGEPVVTLPPQAGVPCEPADLPGESVQGCGADKADSHAVGGNARCFEREICLARRPGASKSLMKSLMLARKVL